MNYFNYDNWTYEYERDINIVLACCQLYSYQQSRVSDQSVIDILAVGGVRAVVPAIGICNDIIVLLQVVEYKHLSQFYFIDPALSNI